MGIKGIERNLSEADKKALQSETQQKVRDGIKEKREIKHFTTENTTENAYGWPWNQVVKEYLRSGYNAADSSSDIVVMGETYKILKRPEVTVFYDAAGDTLFDVTNGRLKKEYEWLMNSDTEDAAEEDITDNGADDDVIPMGTASLKEIVTGVPAPTVEEIAAAKEENAKSVKQRAKEKLGKELNKAKDKSFAEPVIGYLLERCEEDEGFAQDVAQEHKTWGKCFDYIYEQAKKQATNNRAVVRNDVVYEWAEDYYRKDDKAEEQKKAKKAAEAKAKREKEAAEKKAAANDKTTKAAEKLSANNDKKAEKPVPAKEEKPKEQAKPKKNGKEMEGQLDMFSMMGM